MALSDVRATTGFGKHIAVKGRDACCLLVNFGIPDAFSPVRPAPVFTRARRILLWYEERGNFVANLKNEIRSTSQSLRERRIQDECIALSLLNPIFL